MKHYQLYAFAEHRLPFFVVIGLGGSASNPRRMFCIPLEEAKYPVLFPSIFERYERNPKNKFFWKDEILS